MRRRLSASVRAFVAAAGLLATAGAAAAEPWLVVAAEAPASRELAARLEAAGGVLQTELAGLAEIGVLAVEGDARFAALARELPGVAAVATDGPRRWIDPLAAAPLLTLEEVPAAAEPLGDPLAALQWGLQSVEAPALWRHGWTGRGVRIAVLADGIDADHPDLAGNVDRSASASFVPGEPREAPAGALGTRMAGILAARADGVGIVGVAPAAELVDLRVASAATGYGSVGSLLAGILRAADVEARVLLVGVALPQGLAPRAEETRGLLLATGRAFERARERGLTVLAPLAEAHPAETTHIAYPAGLPQVLPVTAGAPVGWGATATVRLDRTASYAPRFEPATQVAAPGGDFRYSGAETCHGVPCWTLDLVLSTTPGGWDWSAGTALAAAHAAGVAALLLEAEPGASPDDLEAALRAGAAQHGSAGDVLRGLGSINAPRSLTALP